MKKNMNSADRIIRLLIAVAIGVLYFTNVITGTVGIVLLIVAVIFALTSFISFCPLYFIFGLRTNKKQKQVKHEIEAQWMGKMQFNALVNGHTIIMDAPERVGGEDQGPIPKPFVLSALSGCTGMDVVSILRKAQKEVDEFSIKVSGEISKKPPIEYIAIHIIYDFKGKEENKQAALDAVTASQELYCGVSHMLKKILPVTWEVQYNGITIFNNKPAETIQLN